MLERIIEAFKNPRNVKPYLVDTITGWTFYQPLMAANEMLIGGVDIKTSLKTRGINMVLGACLTRPLAKLRDKWCEYVWRINSQSSKLKRVVADLTFGLTIVPTIYSSTLAIAGADGKEIIRALPGGTAIVLGTFPVFGAYLNYVRRKFDTTPGYLRSEGLLDDSYLKK